MDISRINARTSAGTPGRPVRCRLFHVQNRRKPRRCQASTVAGCTTWSAALQPCHRCDSHAHSTRSMVVKRSRGRRERFATANWCRSARISRCSTARERTKNWSEWSTETTTDTMSRAYSEWRATSIVTRCTVFLVATGHRGDFQQLMEFVSDASRRARHQTALAPAEPGAVVRTRARHAGDRWLHEAPTQGGGRAVRESPSAALSQRAFHSSAGTC